MCSSHSMSNFQVHGEDACIYTLWYVNRLCLSFIVSIKINSIKQINSLNKILTNGEGY